MVNGQDAPLSLSGHMDKRAVVAQPHLYAERILGG
jgi:hypothetical protein